MVTAATRGMWKMAKLGAGMRASTAASFLARKPGHRRTRHRASGRRQARASLGDAQTGDQTRVVRYQPKAEAASTSWRAGVARIGVRRVKGVA